MPAHRHPLRPDLDQLKHQAKDLLRAIHGGDLTSIAELRRYHPEQIDPASARLADAQLVLARCYEAPSWPRLVQACRLIDAIWRDDIDAVRELVTKHPHLLHEETTIRNSHWGPPMTYAANVGRDRIISMLHELGATDLMSALGRATLQSRMPAPILTPVRRCAARSATATRASCTSTGTPRRCPGASGFRTDSS